MDISRNIIIEIDEETSQIIDRIKTSVTSDLDLQVRGLQSSINNLKSSVENIEGGSITKRDLKESIQNLEDSFDDMSDNLEDLLNNLGKLQNIPDFAPLLESIEASRHIVDSIKSDVITLRTQQSSVAEDVILNRTINENTKNEVLGHLNITAQGLISQIDAIKSMKEDLSNESSANVSQLQTSIQAEICTKFEHLASLTNKQTLQINQIGETLSKAVESLKEKFESDCRTQQSYRETLDSRIEAISKSLTLLTQKIDNIEKQQESHYSSIVDRLYKILVTVTPFWKRNKIDEQ